MGAYEIKSIQSAVEVGIKLRHCWFRGHSKVVDGPLLPDAQREPYHSARENIEFWAGQRFRLRAPSFAASSPDWDDYVSWLLLMQHHGVPTRLLDWTENALVGLYFAVCRDHDLDGELWCMHHGELNCRSANWKACFPDSPPVRYLAAEGFLDGKELIRYQDGLGTQAPHGPMALIPPFQFRRMAAQMSTFTIHRSTEPKAQLGHLLQGDSLVSYVVPAGCKRQLGKHLAMLGFSHENLFHDLDSLGRSVREEILEEDFEISPPPRFTES